MVYIDVLDKQDRKNSRDMLAKILRQNGNVIIFPEGTWNLSPNELIYDIQLGTVDIALETGAVIIPICLEQYEDKKKFVINMGAPMELNQMNDNPREYMLMKTSELRDTLATLKYEIWEREGITRRCDIKENYWGISCYAVVQNGRDMIFADRLTIVIFQRKSWIIGIY